MVCNYQDEQLHIDQKDMKIIGYKSISTDTLDDRQHEDLSVANPIQTSYTTDSPYEHALGEMIEASVVPDSGQANTVHNGETPKAVTVSVGESSNNNSSMVSFYGKDEVVITCRPELPATGKWHTANTKETMSLIEKLVLVILSLLVLIILPIITGTVKHVTGLVPSLISTILVLAVILIFLIFRNRKRIRLTFARLIHYLAARVPYHEMDDA